jgi:hypothetical protein
VPARIGAGEGTFIVNRKVNSNEPVTQPRKERLFS